MQARLQQTLLFGLMATLFTLPSAAQSSNAELDRVLQRLAQFEKLEQAEMLASIRAYILAQEQPIFAAIGRLEPLLKDFELPRIKLDKARYFNASAYAPALKLRTRIIKSNSSTWRNFANKYPDTKAPLAETDWRFSYGRKALVVPDKQSDPAQELRQLWVGIWPENSLLSCQIEALLHTDSSQSELADYFEHSYRNRKGQVYADLTLHRMWGSGRTFGISDVESVAFLRLILDEHQIKSPIAKSLHSGIYTLIRDAFAEFREYQQLRKGLAARFANPNGVVPPILASIAERFDLAWIHMDYDIPAMRKFLRQNPTRKEFLAALAKLEKEAVIQVQIVQEKLAQRAEHSAWVAAHTRKALRREGLLGLGGR